MLDTSRTPVSPAVFVTERQTNSAFGAWFTRQGFSAPHPHVEAVIEQHEDGTLLRVSSKEEGVLFTATVRPSQELNSESFASPQEFAEFIAQGVSSYGLSRHGSRLTKVDLHKEDATYTPLTVTEVNGQLPEDWKLHGGLFDSGFHTCGGRYEWTYHGLTQS